MVHSEDLMPIYEELMIVSFDIFISMHVSITGGWWWGKVRPIKITELDKTQH